MKNLKNASGNFNELLFENRNKNYGAYVIRKEYNESLIKSFFAAMLSLVLFAGSFAVLNKNNATSVIPVAKNYFEQIKIEVDLSYLKKTTTAATNPVKEIEKVKPFNNENKIVPMVVKDKQVLPDEKKIVEPMSNPNPSSGQSNPDPTLNVSAAGGGNPGPLNTSVLGNSEAPMEMASLDVMPEFPGGEVQLMNFLAKHVHYPMIAKENGIKGTVYASFVVDEFGKVKQVKIKRGIFSACDEEVLRVVNLFPDWKPGVYKGQKVSVVFNLPVRFELGQ